MATNGYGIAAVFPRIEAISALHGLAIGGILFLKRCTGFVRCHETDSAFVAGVNGVPASAGTFTNNLRANGSGSTSIDFTAIRADPLFFANGSDFRLQTGSATMNVGGAAALRDCG